MGLNRHTTTTAVGASDDGTGVDQSAPTDFGDVGFVLLAGGKGSRMKASMPKQFLSLRGKPILHHSIELFLDKLPKHAEDVGTR